MRINTIFCFLIFMALIIGCQKKDDIPPILTLNGADTLFHVLNSPFTDPGATATDETDGNISANIYIKNNLNNDKIGEYTLTYYVIDEAGNEARTLTRWVFVYNQGYVYSGFYSMTETMTFPGNGFCESNIVVLADSAINNGLRFGHFACNTADLVFAQVSNEFIVLPFQVFSNDTSGFNLQGNGKVSDTLIQIDYTRTSESAVELWNVTFERLK